MRKVLGGYMDWDFPRELIPREPIMEDEKGRGLAELQESLRRAVDAGVGRMEEYPVLDEKDRKIIELQEDLRLAEHRAFAAEVGERRANQKRRNQRKELKRIHGAVNEKNNRIRNLETELSVARGTLTFRA